MEKRIVNNYERFLTTTVNDIEHIESQSLTGISIIKIFLQPGASIEAATAQVTAVSQTAIRQMPPGISAAAHHPLQRLQRADPAGRAGERVAERAAALRLRGQLHPRRHGHDPGRSDPVPLRRKQRQIMVDIDPRRLFAWGLSPRDVNAALGLQNVILPSRYGEDGGERVPRRS